MLKADIEQDLKTAMLSGDKRLVEVLRMLKSAILYKEVAEGKREDGLEDSEVITVLKKEQKSRRDALALYRQAGDAARADEEEYQLDVIAGYLPEEPSAEAVMNLVKETIQKLGIEDPAPQDMGKIIGAVKASAPNADGALVAQTVKEVLSK